MTAFNKIANTDGHSAYANDNGIFFHTTDNNTSVLAVNGYLQFLNKILKFKIHKKNSCIDIGCGAGFIAKEFHKNGFNIKALEYSDDAVQIAKKYNPELEIIQGDMTKFKEENNFDFIFSREVYLITRVNSFTDQLSTISNIIDSLKPGGVFMLVASDISYPHCMDYDLIIKSLRKDNRISHVSNKYYEIIFTKLSKFIQGNLSYKLIELLLKPFIWYKKRYKNWASQYIITFEKK